jgi:lipopolysaccharide/colanic/teichoic acid biosynthesis glycosyltransferase
VLGVRLPGVFSGGSVPSRLPRTHLAMTVKRGLDLSLGLALGVIAVPVMLAIAAAIYVDSPGPVLFRAKRVGRHGRPFAMYKFRTMVKDAEERLQELAHLNLAEGMTKIPDDPRVTRMGRWLRRFSLDELPQIANIIVGHMSLVGPRPHDKHELPESGLEHDPRLSVRPGLTGLWQISARSDPDLASRVRYDLQYVSRWSLLLDAKIIAKTVPVVVRGRGGLVERKVNLANASTAASQEVPSSSDHSSANELVDRDSDDTPPAAIISSGWAHTFEVALIGGEGNLP